MIVFDVSSFISDYSKVLPSLYAETSSKEFLEKEELLVWDGDEDANERDFL